MAVLEEWGFKAIEADNGKKALQLARKHNGRLSMVISDLVMPHMDGYDPSALGRGLANGHEHLPFKPFDPDTFLDAVARLLESRINVQQASMDGFRARSARLIAGSARLCQACQRLRQESRFVLRRSRVRVLRSQDLITISLFQCRTPARRRLPSAADPAAEPFRLRLMA